MYPLKIGFRPGITSLVAFAYVFLSGQALGQIVDASDDAIPVSDKTAIVAMLNDMYGCLRMPQSCHKSDYLTPAFIADIEAEVQEQSSEKDRGTINDLIKDQKTKHQLTGLDWSFGARIQRFTPYEDGYELSVVMSASFGFAENEHSLCQDTRLMLLVVKEDGVWKIADVSDELIRLYLGCLKDGLPMVMYFSQSAGKDCRSGLTISFGTEKAAVIDYDLSRYRE